MKLLEWLLPIALLGSASARGAEEPPPPPVELLEWLAEMADEDELDIVLAQPDMPDTKEADDE